MTHRWADIMPSSFRKFTYSRLIYKEAIAIDIEFCHIKGFPLKTIILEKSHILFKFGSNYI
jgi:hypothetical protein